MRKADRSVAIFFLLLGGFVAWRAVGLRLGEAGHPGPGLFPFVLAALLCLISIAQWMRLASPSKKTSPVSSISPSDKAVEPAGAAGRRKILWTFVALGAYTFLLELAGFVLTTFLFLLFLYRVVEPRRWAAAVSSSLLATALCYFLFRLLEVRLPAGWWMH